MAETGSCGQCGGPTNVHAVPDGCRELLAGDPSTVRLCERCLFVTPAHGTTPTAQWTPRDTTDALPPSRDAAIAVGLLVTLLESLALHRRELEAVVAFLDAEGVDPLLALDRLVTAPEVDLLIDPARRRDQLAQILTD